MESVTLELAEEAFCRWRTERRSGRESIPENLWEMALGLYPQYKRSKICEGLRLSGSQFKRRLEGDSPRFTNAGFVLASSDEVKANTNPSPAIQLSIEGKERVLTLSVGVDALLQLLPHIGTLL